MKILQLTLTKESIDWLIHLCDTGDTNRDIARQLRKIKRLGFKKKRKNTIV